MKQSTYRMWGALFLLTGGVWLLKTLGYLDIPWYELTGFWHFLLVAAGTVLLLAGRRGSGLAGLLVFLAVAGAAVHGAGHAFGRWWGAQGPEDEKSQPFAPEWSPGRKSDPQVFGYAMDDSIRTAAFTFAGGAGTFRLGAPGDSLFEARTESTLIRYVTNLKLNKSDNSAAIELKMEDASLKPRGKGIRNKVDMRLNAGPLWSLDLHLGAGKADFDLSGNRVRKLNLNTGLSEVDIRLGALSALTEVNIGSGIAALKIRVPVQSGCRLEVGGAVNSVRPEGFVQGEDGTFETPDFEAAARKIYIRYDAGVSMVEISRY